MTGSLQIERRWVICSGEDEASRLPPEWHGWLQYTINKPPPADGGPPYPWMKDHLPNLTGTEQAYRLSRHTLRDGNRGAVRYAAVGTRPGQIPQLPKGALPILKFDKLRNGAHLRRKHRLDRSISSATMALLEDCAA